MYAWTDTEQKGEIWESENVTNSTKHFKLEKELKLKAF